ncbi:MAG: hypothetical protein ACMUEM_02260 [Flavobacteriales bacterium AspAUS03]
MNTIKGKVIEGIHKAIDLAKKDFEGLVIANLETHFLAGANLAYDHNDDCRIGMG